MKIHEKCMMSPDYFIFPPLVLFFSLSLQYSLHLPFSCVMWIDQQGGLNRGTDSLKGLKVRGEGLWKGKQGEEIRAHV